MPSRGSRKNSAGKVLYASANADTLEALAADRGQGRPDPPRHISIDPEHVERDLARLVLGIIELLRQVLERQAVRRVESGHLAEDEVERLGQALMRLEIRMAELKLVFGLADADVALCLGALREVIADET